MAVALLDSNVLVHASYRGSLHYANSARLLALGLGKSGRFCIAPQNLVEFAAVVTRKRFVDPPMTAADVLRISDLLYRSRRLSKIYPQRGTVLRTMREGHALSIQGPRWYDLFLAVNDARRSTKSHHHGERQRLFEYSFHNRLDHREGCKRIRGLKIEAHRCFGVEL